MSETPQQPAQAALFSIGDRVQLKVTLTASCALEESRLGYQAWRPGRTVAIERVLDTPPLGTRLLLRDGEFYASTWLDSIQPAATEEVQP